MKRQDTDHIQSGLLRLLDDFARVRKLSFADQETQTLLLEELGEEMQKHRTDPIRLHGFRAQSMFAYLAAALGNVKIVTEEDSGMFFDGVGDLRQPDFKIVTLDGSRFLVEVKNFRSDDPLKPYQFKKDYLDSICAYAELIGLPLKFAIYWSRLRLWTLVDSSHLDRTTPKSELQLLKAMQTSEMRILGDCMIGTKPPLALRIHADQTKPRSVSEGGEAQFTIGNATLHSANTEITNDVEKKLAWFFMLNGNWTDVQHVARTDSGNLLFTELSVSPEEPTENQGFEVLGLMSQMISNQYLQATSKDGIIRSLAPDVDVTQLGAIIPPGYKGEALPLWQFELQPYSTDGSVHPSC